MRHHQCSNVTGWLFREESIMGMYPPAVGQRNLAGQASGPPRGHRPQWGLCTPPAPPRANQLSAQHSWEQNCDVNTMTGKLIIPQKISTHILRKYKRSLVTIIKIVRKWYFLYSKALENISNDYVQTYLERLGHTKKWNRSCEAYSILSLAWLEIMLAGFSSPNSFLNAV